MSHEKRRRGNLRSVSCACQPPARQRFPGMAGARRAQCQAEKTRKVEEKVARRLPNARKSMYKQCSFPRQVQVTVNSVYVDQEQRSNVRLARGRECRDGECLADTLFLQLSDCGVLVLDGTKSLQDCRPSGHTEIWASASSSSVVLSGSKTCPQHSTPKPVYRHVGHPQTHQSHRSVNLEAVRTTYRGTTHK